MKRKCVKDSPHLTTIADLAVKSALAILSPRLVVATLVVLAVMTIQWFMFGRKRSKKVMRVTTAIVDATWPLVLSPVLVLPNSSATTIKRRVRKLPVVLAEWLVMLALVS